MSYNESPEFKKLFAKFVESNRANGIDPHKPEPEGRVCMIRTDDVYWDTGRTLSSQEIDKLFRKLKL